MGSSPPRRRRCWASPAARRSRRRSASARTDDCSSTPGGRDELASGVAIVGAGQGRAGVMVDQQAPTAGRRSRTRLVVQGVLSLVLVVAIFYYLFTKIDLAQTWAAITDMTWQELAILGLLAVWNLCTYALVWMAVTPGLGFWRAMVMTQATTAVANTVPGGSAIGIGMTYSMLGSWGYSRSRTTTAVLVSGVWNSFIKLGMPVLALALVLLQGGAGGGRVLAAVVGIAGLVAAIVIFALLLRSQDQARRFGLLAGRVATRLRRLIRRGPVTGWGRGAGRVRLRPAGHRHPDHPGWGRAGRGGPDRRAGRGRRRHLPGGRGRADLPGAHLGAADPGRHRLLCVVATPGMDHPDPRHPAPGRRTAVTARAATSHDLDAWLPAWSPATSSTRSPRR